MSDFAIHVNNVSKKYCKRLRYSILYGMQDIAKKTLSINYNSEKLRRNEFWALNDISFELKRGETLGIIGHNGAGKTTILKLLNGIIMPDKGRIDINGRTGALIEIGAGFHPLLTGRENIYINGAILGMSRKEINSKFDSIVDFADIGDFLDTPVKNYSSGMFVRLGFAIAVHCEPEILLVDEVLAVGDQQFQRRCINKLNNLQKSGMAIVFVSHALTTVEGISSRVIWMDKGKVKMEGLPAKVIEGYLYHLVGTYQTKSSKPVRKWGTYEAEILDVELLNSRNEKISRVISGEETTVILTVKFNKQIVNPIIGIIFKNDKGTLIYGMNTRWRHMTLGTFEADEMVKIIFKQKMQLTGGLYQIDPAIAYSDCITFCDWQENALEFIVDLPIQADGFANLDSQISIIKL